MEKFFKLKEHGTDVKTEFIAGATTFLSMVYILAVNPSILSAAGMDSGAVFAATDIFSRFVPAHSVRSFADPLFSVASW